MSIYKTIYANNLPINNYSATTNPTANDDIDARYSIGSHWINLTTDQIYVCVDNTSSAALWTYLSDYSSDYSLVSAGGSSLVNTPTGTQFNLKGLTATSSKIGLTVNANDIGIDVLQSNITGVGALDSGSITSNFGNINIGTSSITTGQCTIDQLNLNNGVITYSGTTGNNKIIIPDNLANALTIDSSDGLNYIRFITTNSSELINLLQEVKLNDHLIVASTAVASTPASGTGVLYKKTGDTGLWWKDDTGVESNLALGGEQDRQQVALETTISTSATVYIDMSSATLTTSNTSDKEYTVFFSGEFSSSFSGRTIHAIINVDGTDITVTERRNVYSTKSSYQTLNLNYKTAPLGNGIVIKIRWHYEGNKQLDCTKRTFIIDGVS